MKVLACAYACNPYRGSEGGVGWGWVNAIARNHEVWVLTDAINRSDIDEYVAVEPERYQNIHFAYVPRLRRLRLEKVWPPAYLTTYRIWQRAAFREALELNRSVRFDLVHVITYVGFRVPGDFYRLGIPFVWGPIGGLENTPWRLLPAMGTKGALHFACRNIVNAVQKRFLVAPKHAMYAARGGIIAATSSIQREICAQYGEESTVICEIGLPSEVAVTHSRRASSEPIRLSWSGLHMPGKALPLLLSALARLPERVKWRLDILGVGPSTQKWKRLVHRTGIGARCKWLGQLPRGEALQVVRDSHVFVTTSLKELTSTVIVEALAQGVPVVCPDHCGFSDAIDESCGLRLPIATPGNFIAELAHAIERLHAEESLRCRLAEGALRRASRFSWEVKARHLESIYAAKFERARRPDHEPRQLTPERVVAQSGLL